MPRVRDRRARQRFVEENASALFLRTSDRMHVSPLAVTRDGEWWAAAYDATALDAIVRDARARGMRVASVHPERALLPTGLGRRWLLVRREPLAWYPSRGERSRRIRIAATMISVAWLASASAAAVAAPAVRQHGFVARHVVEIERARTTTRETERARAELARVSRQLAEISAFAAARGQLAALAATISDAMPDSTAIVALRIEPRQGSLTAITTDVAALLVSLSQLDGVTNVRASGALTAEIIGGARFERATIRFRRGGSAR